MAVTPLLLYAMLWFAAGAVSVADEHQYPAAAGAALLVREDLSLLAKCQQAYTHALCAYFFCLLLYGTLQKCDSGSECDSLTQNALAIK